MKNFARFTNRVCRAFTVSAVLMLLVNRLNESDAAQASAVSVSSFLSLFLVTVLYAAATALLTWQKLAFGLRLALHCLLICGSVWGILYLPVASSANSTRLIMFLVVLLVYWLFMGVYLFVRRQKGKEREKRKEPVYQNRFSK